MAAPAAAASTLPDANISTTAARGRSNYNAILTAGDTRQRASQPDWIRQGGRSDDHALIDIGAFTRAEQGTFGNAGVGLPRAQGYANVDLTLAKRFRIDGRRSAQVRIEAFNVFNHPSFGPPGRNIGDPNTFGTITTTTSTARVVEFVGKFYF